jgi:cytochrome oxidase assembly protein ShyY1
MVLVMVPILLTLGKWQLDRRIWKADLIAQVEAAPLLPPATPKEFFAAMAGDISLQFRRAKVDCFPGPVKPYDLRGGQSADGETGYLVLVDCGGPHASGHPDLVVVAGWIQRPDAVSLLNITTSFDGLIIEHPYGRANNRPQFMLIPQLAVAPLHPSLMPKPGDLPDNHLAYAVQWFGFALTLIIIYLIYLRRWRREQNG